MADSGEYYEGSRSLLTKSIRWLPEQLSYLPFVYFLHGVSWHRKPLARSLRRLRSRPTA